MSGHMVSPDPVASDMPFHGRAGSPVTYTRARKGRKAQRDKEWGMIIDHAWLEHFPGAITVCDERGTIIEMNAKSASTFQADGGRALVGTNLRACHPEAALAKLEALFEGRQTNVYTIRKAGIRKLIYQSPWYRDGQFAGIVELSLEIPAEVPEFVRA
jgi:transcriptional regulator with PAS, ATPase and Fis domain